MHSDKFQESYKRTFRRPPPRYIIHKHINQSGAADKNVISADQTIYLFVNNTSPKTGALMSEIYDSYKSDDGFLYITYSAENTLG